MPYLTPTRASLHNDDAFLQDALNGLARLVPLWGEDQVRQHVMNMAEMHFWREFLEGRPSDCTVTLSLQLSKNPNHGPHCLSNPRFLWGYNRAKSTGSGAPYSHTSPSCDDSKNEIAALYWPICNRHDEPLRDGEGVDFWQKVLRHPRLTVTNSNRGNYAGFSLRIRPSEDLTVEPWTPYFEAWMNLRERLRHNSTSEQAALEDHRGDRRLQSVELWVPPIERSTVRRRVPR